MKLPSIHHSGKSIGIAWIFLGNNLFDLVQIRFIMSMLILAPHRLDIVIPLHRKDDIILLKQSFIILSMKNCRLFLLYILRMPPASKVPPVMAKPNILAFQILPGPVKPCQF